MLPDDLAAMIRGYQASRIVLTAVELDIFTVVGDGATADEVSGRLGTDRQPTGMLLDSLVALGLVKKDGDRYRNGEVAARYFDDRSPESERLATMHTVKLWHSWTKLTDCVRDRSAAAGRETPSEDPVWTEAFIAAMARNSAERAPQVIQAVGADGVRRMLDVGGGPGSYSIAFAKANPGLRAVIADKPEVLAIARRHIEQANLSDRVETAIIDIASEPLGTDYDLVFVSNICHMFSPRGNEDLLRRCGAATIEGGRLVIQDFILDENRTSPARAALFAINMLVATAEGNSYTESEYRTWMESAGFADVVRIPLELGSELMSGLRKGR